MLSMVAVRPKRLSSADAKGSPLERMVIRWNKRSLRGKITVTAKHIPPATTMPSMIFKK
jgi:hypothetical protein